MSTNANYRIVSNEFDTTILKVVPEYEKMHEIMIKAIDKHKDDVFDVLDIGCGTGNSTLALKKYFPNARVLCLDANAQMLETACQKLQGFENISYAHKSIEAFESIEQFDIVIGSLVSHNMHTMAEKKAYYQKVQGLLKKEGSYVSIDLTLSTNEQINDFNIGQWKEFMLKSFSELEVECRWLALYKETDKPISFYDMFALLKEVGFVDYKIEHNIYNFSVMKALT